MDYSSASLQSSWHLFFLLFFLYWPIASFVNPFIYPSVALGLSALGPAVPIQPNPLTCWQAPSLSFSSCRLFILLLKSPAHSYPILRFTHRLVVTSLLLPVFLVLSQLFLPSPSLHLRHPFYRPPSIHLSPHDLAVFFCFFSGQQSRSSIKQTALPHPLRFPPPSPSLCYVTPLAIHWQQTALIPKKKKKNPP